MAPPDAEVAGSVHQLVNLARRFRAKAEKLHPDLEFVAYALLSQPESTG
jgi:hypothetical protein